MDFFQESKQVRKRNQRQWLKMGPVLRGVCVRSDGEVIECAKFFASLVPCQGTEPSCQVLQLLAIRRY